MLLTFKELYRGGSTDIIKISHLMHVVYFLLTRFQMDFWCGDAYIEAGFPLPATARALEGSEAQLLLHSKTIIYNLCAPLLPNKTPMYTTEYKTLDKSEQCVILQGKRHIMEG